MLYKISLKLVPLLLFFFPIAYIIGPAIADITLSLVSFLFLLILLFTKNEIKLINDKLFISLIIFWFYLIISSFWSPNFEKSIISSLGYIRFLLLPFALNLFLKENFYFVGKLSKILFVVILFLSLDIILQNFLGKDIFGFPSADNGMRNSGFFGSEYIAGSFIAKIFFISFFFIKTGNVFLKHNLYFFFVFLIIIFTGERMAFFLCFFIFVLYNIYKYNLKKNIIIFLSSCLLIFSILISFEKNKLRMYDNFKDIVLYGSYDNDGKYTETTIDPKTKKIRKKIFIVDTGWGAHWLTALNIYKENKLLGSGIRSFRFKCNNPAYATISDSDRGRCTTHPHNFYIEILSELGILGMTLFIIIFIQLCNINFKKFKINKDHIYLFIPFIICIWPFAITGSIFSNYFATLFWYVVSLSASISFKPK